MFQLFGVHCITTHEPPSTHHQIKGRSPSFEVGQIVVEPLWLYGTDTWVRFQEFGSFRKLRVPEFGVLQIRILLFRVLYKGPIFSETPI